MNGISPQLRRNLFIFCQDPHSYTITTEKLLEAIRKPNSIRWNKTTTKFHPRLAILLSVLFNQPLPPSLSIPRFPQLITSPQCSQNACRPPKPNSKSKKLKLMQFMRFKPIIQFVHVTLHTGGNLLPPEVVLSPVNVVGRMALLQVDSPAELRVLQQEPVRTSSVGIVVKRTIMHVTVRLLL